MVSSMIALLQLCMPVLGWLCTAVGFWHIADAAAQDTLPVFVISALGKGVVSCVAISALSTHTLTQE